MSIQIPSGGPLPDEVGDYLVSRGVNVVSGYGGTEFSVGTVLRPNLRSKEEWSWFEFAPSFPIRWLEHSEGKQVLYELQVLVRFITLCTSLPRLTQLLCSQARLFVQAS